MKKAFIFLLIITFSFFLGTKASADEYQELQKQINDLTTALNLSLNATRPLQSELDSLQTRIRGIKNRVSTIENELIIKRTHIEEGYKKLAKQKEELNKAIADYYKKSYYNSPLTVFLSAGSAKDVIRLLAFQRAIANQDREKIVNFALLLLDLENQKKSLESEETQLTSLKANLDEQSSKLDKIVSGARAYQATLSSQIAVLSARQQEILGRRLNALGIPRSAGSGAPACVDDRGKDPGFGPRLAFFTYGVPNRTGLNQYGAHGRANAGQNYEQILQAYYANYELKKDYSKDITINVEGYGPYNIEEYVKRIYEMPNSFHSEALKAQAIAARSYALAYTNNGAGSICTTEKCQVFKPDLKGGAWDQAVNDTAGQVMVQGGSPVKAWYSSTHGGYIFSTSELPGWSATSWTKHATDTTTGSAGSFGDLAANAYDRDSPWFYCDWGGRGQNKTAWLKESEVADIVNVISLARADSSTKEKLYQTDKPHPYGGEVWNEERVKSELRARNITPQNSISGVTVSADLGFGQITTVSLSGDAGTFSFSGAEFKDWFNLRAPANIQIVGPLYNIERQ